MERNNRKEKGQFSLVEAKRIFVLRHDSSLGRLTDWLTPALTRLTGAKKRFFIFKILKGKRMWIGDVDVDVEQQTTTTTKGWEARTL